MTVTLDQDAWNRLLAILSTAPWREANPLIMAIGQQLREQDQAPRPNGIDREARPTDGGRNQSN